MALMLMIQDSVFGNDFIKFCIVAQYKKVYFDQALSTNVFKHNGGFDDKSSYDTDGCCEDSSAGSAKVGVVKQVLPVL